MQPLAQPDSSMSLQTGYRTVALEPGAQSPLRLSVVVKDAADPLGGPFVLVDDYADASVYLGCLSDAAGHVHEWLEIWVQNLENLAARYHGGASELGNETMDAEWGRRAERFFALDPLEFIVTGWEQKHPAPLFFDLGLQNPIHPSDKASGAEWQLCVDDAALMAAGLPPYRASLARYLTLVPAQSERRFVPVSAGAPTNSATIPLRDAVGTLVPFNPSGGLMLVRKLAPLDFEEWLALLAGEPWKGIAHGKKSLRLGGVFRTLHDVHSIQQGGAHWFLSQQGRAGRLLETFYLRLQTLFAACRAVRESVAAQQLPFLNLNAESFRVRLSAVDSGLPVFWTARTSLARPGESLALPVETTDARYFVSSESGKQSIYRPPDVGIAVNGRGTVRIREVVAGDEELTSLEGTLLTQEALGAATHDLLWLRLALPFGRLNLYGHFEKPEGLARGETRFRTLPQKLSSSAVLALREAEGVSIPHVEFETVPVLSTPCDLYSLAVIAVRTFVVNSGNSLPIALDEVLSFARLGAAAGSTEPLADRLAMLARDDPKWLAALGPQWLLNEPLPAEEAATLFPLGLWWETLALIMRCVPGLVPESFRRDLGDAPPLALHKVFDEPIGQLESLLLRSRSLIVIDWQQNREIRSVIHRVLERS